MHALRTYLLALVRATRLRLVLALTLMTLSAATEGVGLVLLVPLLGLVGVDVDKGGTGGLAQMAAAMFRLAGRPWTLPSALATFVAVVTLRGLLGRWQTRVTVAMEYEFSASLRERLYRAIAHARWLFLAHRRSSDFIHALTAETDRVAHATISLTYLMGTAFVFVVYAWVAARLSWQTTGLVLGCGFLLLAILRRRVRVSGDAGEELTEATQRVYADAVEYLGAIKTVKSYAAEHRTVERFRGHSQEVVHAYRRAISSQAALKFWFDVGAVVALAVVVYVSREVISISAATLLMLIFLFSRTMPRLGTMQEFYQVLLNMLPGFENVWRTIRECEAAAERAPAAGEPVELRAAIRFIDVSFRYQHEGEAVLEWLNLVLPARQITALVGPSGAGKSTVADLLMGLITPDEGRILIDTQVLTPDSVHSWRSRIGYVPQDGLLFHDSVRANLLWARPEASEAELAEALRLAAADEFVARLPARLDTVVGDRGVLLSAGERQRLMLARALLQRPTLLVLDEATSAVDLENERRIHKAIRALRGRVTVLLITHRLSAVQNADFTYVLDRGRVVDAGTWFQLVSKADGRFLALAGGLETVSTPAD